MHKNFNELITFFVYHVLNAIEIFTNISHFTQLGKHKDRVFS